MLCFIPQSHHGLLMKWLTDSPQGRLEENYCFIHGVYLIAWPNIPLMALYLTQKRKLMIWVTFNQWVFALLDSIHHCLCLPDLLISELIGSWSFLRLETQTAWIQSVTWGPVSFKEKKQNTFSFGHSPENRLNPEVYTTNFQFPFTARPFQSLCVQRSREMAHRLKDRLDHIFTLISKSSYYCVNI